MKLYRARHLAVAAAAALLLVGGLASPAVATEQTFKRAATNLLFGPFDCLLAPITGPRAVYRNLRDIDDSPGVRIVYTVPGVVWNTAFNIAGGFLRTFTGLLEIGPAILLLPFEADMDPMFAPPERANALIDEYYDEIPIKIGIDYLG